MSVISFSQVAAAGDAANPEYLDGESSVYESDSKELLNDTQEGDISWAIDDGSDVLDLMNDSIDDEPSLSVIPVLGEPSTGTDLAGSEATLNLTIEPAVAAPDVVNSEIQDELLDVAELITVQGRIVYENVITRDQLGSSLPATAHSYYPNQDLNWIFYGSPSATQVEVFFSKIEVQPTYDHLYVRDVNNNLVFQTQNLLYVDKWVTVPGNLVKIQFTSDSSTQYWGFELTKFVPSQYRYIGVAGATVEIWDDDVLLDQKLCEVTTDISGYFIKEDLSNQDDWGANGQDIFVIARTTSANARVIEELGGDYTFYTSVWVDIPDEYTLDIGAWCSSDASNSAWIVYSALMDGWYTFKNGGPSDTIPFVKAVWTLGHSSDYGYGGCTDVSHYHYDDAAAGQIHLTSNDGQLPDTVQHEYGHHLMWYAYDDWIPASYWYDHSMKDNLKESEAWQEGWSELIPGVVGQWTGKGDRYRDCGGGYATGYFFDMEGSQQIQFGGIVQSYPGDGYWHGGDTNEGTISYALYDVYDSSNDGTDTYYGGLTMIWTTMKSGRHYGLSDWYDGWRDCYKSYTSVITGCGNAIKQGSRGTINYDPVMFYEDFSDGYVTDWTTVTSGGSVSSYSSPLGIVPAPCMKIYKSLGSGEASASHRFPTQGGDFVVEVKVRTADYNGFYYVMVMEGPEYGIHFSLQPDSTHGHMWYWDTAYWKDLDTPVIYSKDTWYMITFNIHAATGYYDIYVDGQLKKSNAKFYGGVAEQKFLDTVKLQAGFSSQDEVVCYADEVVTRGGSRLFIDQFKDDITDWTTVTTGGPVTWDSTKGFFESPSIKLYKQYTTGGTSAKHTFSAKTDGRVFIEARTMVSTIDSYKWCYVNLYYGTSIESYLVLRNGCLWYYSEGSWTQTTFTYSANAWFKIGLDIDLESNRYDIYANGAKIASYIPLYSNSGGIDNVNLQAGCYNDLLGVTLWVDDIIVNYR